MCISKLAGTVKSKLKEKGVKIAVVAGVFPSSQSFLEVKLTECKIAVAQGANEVDIVLPLHHFLNGEYDLSSEEIREIKQLLVMLT